MAKRKPTPKRKTSKKSAAKFAKGTTKQAKSKVKKVDLGPALEWESQFWQKHLIPGVLLFVLGLVLYGSTINYEYVLDDNIVIAQNQYTKEGFAGIPDILGTEHFKGYLEDQKTILGDQGDLVEGGRYRPLSTVTFAIELGLLGGDAPAEQVKANELKEKVEKEGNRELKQKYNEQWKAQKTKTDKLWEEVWPKTKPLSHAINILLYALTGILLFRVLHVILPKSDGQKWFVSLAFIASALFILHPIHSEVVANIKGLSLIHI